MGLNLGVFLKTRQYNPGFFRMTKQTILRAFFSSQQRQDHQTIFIVLLSKGVIALSGNATVV